MLNDEHCKPCNAPMRHMAERIFWCAKCGSVYDRANQEIWAPAVVNEKKRILGVLRDLYDEQNGPPLLRRSAQWEEAMRRAKEELQKGGE